MWPWNLICSVNWEVGFQPQCPHSSQDYTPGPGRLHNI